VFRRRGWLVVRGAGSKPVDLVCLRRGEAVLVECKLGEGRVRRSEVVRLLEMASRAGARAVLAVAGKRGRLRLIDAETSGEFRP